MSTALPLLQSQYAISIKQKKAIYKYMTHFQDLFIRNLRFYRTNAGYSQLKFSELINLTPNYLNAVENGKYFPSPEVIDKICKALGILHYQLFLEQPEISFNDSTKNQATQAINKLKQEVSILFDKTLLQL